MLYFVICSVQRLTLFRFVPQLISSFCLILSLAVSFLELFLRTLGLGCPTT